jgi:LPS O-antigen subunit length determinant protein (WzzB/FepE family)
MNETLPSDEIDLLQLIETIWDGKWRIIAITAACVAGVFAFQAISPTPNFVATISSKEADQYAPLNSLELFKVTREDLLAQYN